MTEDLPFVRVSPTSSPNYIQVTDGFLPAERRSDGGRVKLSSVVYDSFLEARNAAQLLLKEREAGHRARPDDEGAARPEPSCIAQMDGFQAATRGPDRGRKAISDAIYDSRNEAIEAAVFHLGIQSSNILREDSPSRKETLSMVFFCLALAVLGSLLAYSKLYEPEAPVKPSGNAAALQAPDIAPPS